MKSTSIAGEDYLEQILRLIEAKGYARVIDIAKNLGISQASVSNMIQRLDGEGLVKYEKYRGMILTSEGERIAQAITQRHETLATFLRLFDLDELDIHRDVEGMEHHISSATLQVFQGLVEELESRPELVESIKARTQKIPSKRER